MIDHKNAKTTWKTIRVDRERTLETILMVKTDLPFTPDKRGFDQAALDSLVDAVVTYLKKHGDIDRAEFHWLGEGMDA